MLIYLAKCSSIELDLPKYGTPKSIFLNVSYICSNMVPDISIICVHAATLNSMWFYRAKLDEIWFYASSFILIFFYRPLLEYGYMALCSTLKIDEKPCGKMKYKMEIDMVHAA